MLKTHSQGSEGERRKDVLAAAVEHYWRRKKITEKL